MVMMICGFELVFSFAWFYILLVVGFLISVLQSAWDLLALMRRSF